MSLDYFRKKRSTGIPSLRCRAAAAVYLLGFSTIVSAQSNDFTQTFQAIASNQVFVLGSDGKLWLENGPFGVVPPPRKEVDGNVRTFQALSASEALVLGSDGNLWLEHSPFGAVPPARQQIDGNVRFFRALSTLEVLVLGTDGKLWLEHAPFGNVPPARQQVDGNVQSFQGLSDSEVLVLGTDSKLWLEHAPFGNVPPARQQVDGNVQSFQGISDSEVLVLGIDGKLWLEHGPFGSVPPARQQVDGNVQSFQGLGASEAFVLGTDGKLWLEHAPFGNVPPTRQQVDGNVEAFQALNSTLAVILGTDAKLWLEFGPFGTVIPPARNEIDANVMLPYQPPASYTLGGLTLSVRQDFVLPAPARPIAFADLDPGSPTYSAAQAIWPYLNRQLLCPGCTLSANFLPGNQPTRAQLAVLLISLLASGNKLQILNAADTNATLAGVLDVADPSTLPILARPYVATAIRIAILTLKPGNLFEPVQPASPEDQTAALNEIQRQFGLPITVAAE